MQELFSISQNFKRHDFKNPCSFAACFIAEELINIVSDKKAVYINQEITEPTEAINDCSIPESETILIQRTIRSGQKIQYSGHIVILGDVNPGAEIIAGGNIMVLGCLRGIAHAGVFGNQLAAVAAFKLKPTQLRIANHITRAPDGESWQPQNPEIARVKNGVVVIEKLQSMSERWVNIT